jgi:signal peptide peptidase SppA
MFCSSSREVIIPVISLCGVISSSTELSFIKVNKLLKKAFAIPHIKTIAIIIDSPGGSPVQSELIHNRIRSLAEEHDIEVLTFIHDVGASGGYYIACAGDEIYALDSSIVGSIGVISGGFGFQEFIKKHGIERRIIAHGENKSLLDPFMPVNTKDTEIILDVSKDIYEGFVEHVKSRRGERLLENNDTLFSGKIWSGKKAKELGLIDDIGDIYSILHKKYGENIQIKYIEESKSILSSLKGLMGIETMFKGAFQEALQSVIESNSTTKFH